MSLFNLALIATIVLFILKIFNLITIGWIAVLAPLWGLFGISLIIGIIIALKQTIDEWLEDNNYWY